MLELCSTIFASEQSPSLTGLLACPPLRDLLLRGALTGILALAGLFNLILLFANPRNISHLVFSAISLLASFAVILPYLLAEALPVSRAGIEFQVFQAWIPALLFVFVYVLFPALRQSRTSPLYRSAVACGFYAVLPTAVGLSLGALASWLWFDTASVQALPAFMRFAGVACTLAAALATGCILLVAAFERQQGALVATTGFALYAFGMGAAMSAGSRIDSDAAITGVLGFVLAMVFLMGPNRYEMHRQLRRSRNVLRDANRKLRELDALKNRYIASSAREMQSPLSAMLERCLRLIEDPAYRLGPSQLSALSGVMDMARKMIVRNERAAVLFAEDGLRPREFDVARFLEQLAVILEEQLPPLRFSLSLGNPIPGGEPGGPTAGDLRVFADPTLIETAFIELAENAASHGVAASILLRVRLLQSIPGARAAFDRIELAFVEPAAMLSAAGLRELVGEFRQGSPKAPGVGLGLSLVRRIAENHGSRLEIHEYREYDPEPSAGHGNADGMGLEYRFSVPRAGAKAMRPPEVEWGLRHLRLLLGQKRFEQADTEARKLATRFPETRREAAQLLEDARPR